MRMTQDIERGEPIMIILDGETVTAYPGETVATALLASGRRRFRDDRSNRSRGLFCNMGTCCECMLWVMAPGSQGWRRLRACMTLVSPGLEVRTTEDEERAD